MIDNSFFVYIITSKYNTAFYTGVTKTLVRRINEHRNGTGSVFTHRYNLNKLVYHEVYPDSKSAIVREKQIKAGSRKKKLELIHSLNPNWDDLFENWLVYKERLPRHLALFGSSQ